MSGIAFQQLRTDTNPGLEGVDAGGTEGAIRVKAGTGLTNSATGVDIDGSADTFKEPCRVKTSANVTLSGGAPDTVNSVSLNIGDRILVADQTTASEDGIYEVQTVGTGANGTWVRTVDAPVGGEAAGWYIQVLEGSLENLYKVDANLGDATIGTDGWSLTVFSGGASRTAGAGLTDGAGDDLDVNTGDGIGISSDRVVAQVSTSAAGQQYGGLVRNRNSDGSAAGTADQGFLAVQTDDSTLAVNASNQVIVKNAGVTENQLNTSVAGDGLTGGGGAALAVGAGTGITVNANDVAFDATAADGNGLTGTGSSLAVDPDSETGGNIQAVNVTANGVGLDVSAIAGTGLEADGSANLRLAAQGNGIAGGAGSTLSVQADTGISVSGTGVAIDNDSTVSFVAPVSWSFPVGVTAQGLFAVGTPVDANHVVNKTYVDNLLTGVTWLEPVVCLCLVGNRTVAQINALGDPGAVSDVYVVTDSGTLTLGSLSVAAGDVVQWDDANTQWIKIVSNSGGFVPSGIRFSLNTGTALVAPYTDGVDDGKIVEFDGTNNDPLTSGTVASPSNGDAVLVVAVPGETPPTLVNTSYVFNGTVPTGTWTQFSGAGGLNAGTGLSTSGNTINFNSADTSLTVNADDVQVNLESAGSGAGGLSTVAGGLRVLAGDGIELTASGVAVDIEAAGAGEGGLAFDSSELRINVDGTTAPGSNVAAVMSLNANGLAISVDDSTLEASAAGGQLRVKDLGITTGKLAANAVSLAKTDIRFREEEFAAASFTNANPSTVDLAATALIGTQADFYVEVYRNGVADMTNQGSAGSVSTGTEFKVDNTGAGGVGRVSIGANVSASGNTYRVKYLSTAV